MFKKPPLHQSLSGFRHDNEKKAVRKKILGITLVLVLLAIIFRSPVQVVLAHGFQYISSPLLIMKGSVGDKLYAVKSFFSSKLSLLEENMRLKDALDQLASSAYSYDIYRTENEELKSVFGRHSKESLLLARVLAAPGRAPFDSLVIDIGQNLDIAVGTPVYIDGDFIIGEVSKTFGFSSVVTLYSTSGNELSVLVGSSSVPTTAYGVGGGNFRIILPKGIEINVGDIVEIPSITPHFAGVIEAVQIEKDGSLQEIFFQWPINLNSFRFVYLPAPDEKLVLVQ